MLAIIAWTGATSGLMFYLLKKFNMLRVEPGMEFKGMDMLKHGESAYPADAWVESQYRTQGNNETMSYVSRSSYDNALS